MTRNLTCIVCPKGCSLTVELDGKNIISVTGHTCKRGQEYAYTECTNPKRTVTSTARTANGGVIPVKTDRAIPKELMFDCMREIDNAVVALPAHIGDVVIENLLGTGANIIVTANME